MLCAKDLRSSWGIAEEFNLGVAGEHVIGYAQAMTPDSGKASLFCEKTFYDGVLFERRREGGGPETVTDVLKGLFAIQDQQYLKRHTTTIVHAPSMP